MRILTLPAYQLVTSNQKERTGGMIAGQVADMHSNDTGGYHSPLPRFGGYFSRTVDRSVDE